MRSTADPLSRILLRWHAQIDGKWIDTGIFFECALLWYNLRLDVFDMNRDCRINASLHRAVSKVPNRAERMVANPIVLLVDDEPDSVRLLRRVLQADGCQVLEAADGDQALALYRNAKPDLILLDIILPRRDGIGVLKEIRRGDSITAIIMISALSSERTTIDAMLAGADDYVSKPFRLRELRIRVHQALDKAALRRENALLQEKLDIATARIRLMRDE